MQQMTSIVTRVEVADCVRSAFEADDGVGCARAELLAAAGAAGARPEVLAALASLSTRRFQRLRDLWAELGHLPIEADEASQ